MPDPDFSRVRQVNAQPIREEGKHVLYWMTANRRPHWNHALDRALEHAKELDKPLLVFEPLRIGYRWASDRMHRFVMDGMLDNGKAFEKAGVTYYAYVERAPDEGQGLLAHLAESACVVVTDDWPHYFLPRMLKSAAKQVPVRMEAVDSVGLWPVRAVEFEKPLGRAYDFRRFLQRNLAPALEFPPKANPLARYKAPEKAKLPRGLKTRWPEAKPEWLRSETGLAPLDIDHSVAPTGLRGGALEGARHIKAWMAGGLRTYHEKRTDVNGLSTSGLSPFLHFGHVSTHQILGAIAKVEGWSTASLAGNGGMRSGARSGWWQMGEAAEGFLDQIVTWRELGFHRSANDPQFGTYRGLPEWAKATLEEHAKDERPYLYTAKQFEEAATHDDLWNAAQNQLRREGIIHNYLRMLWGKKILHWSPNPKTAFQTMEHLNNKYALDGRDPNSYSGIGWVVGLFDRAWGPERPVFGKIRYMSSDNTRRKLKVKPYIARYSSEQESRSLFP